MRGVLNAARSLSRLAPAAALCLAPLAAPAAERVLSIGGAVTEIVYALGQQDRLVARDTTSTWPPESETLPDVGYMRALSPEGVLSVGPQLILAEDGAGPAETIEVLHKASVPVVTVPEAFTGQGIVEKVRIVGDALGVPDRADALGAQIDAELDRAEALAAGVPQAQRQRVLFILSTQNGRIMAAGRETSAEAIITLAGGINALTGVQGYKPVTAEAITAAAPDVILMMDRGGDHDTTADELFAMPALAVTPAGRARQLVRMDGLLLLGFGPRTAQAVTGLHAALYGDPS